ncbi:MAG: hypothetical protein QT03_C0001G0925 [archaeon GW2011_AR10]|uniref:CDP-2,3-bis-(O-geranylgeranyl)-sn-glycerol synthase n=1 Tax=Candidatus Iainarchaeum sp. TaxID=3101447 RepID=A0A7J4IUC6_9ARCH|nr:MAG: hypothetical protein QT03_C0001G0925 [archaeon GW2011_AR10]HIH08394.1 CDP-2,3-bis-(O-geranylgeranyl)-sn-glycerol synthase [Candidatus Diapherotrites archaeon]
MRRDQVSDAIIKILLYIAPMYLANSTAMLFGGKKPLDLNKKFFDGKPILGKGKTFRGTAIGVLIGSATALAVSVLFEQQTLLLSENYLALGVLLSAGAIAGDIIASFFKRRNSIPQGTQVLFLDQLDFVFGGMIAGSIYYVPDFFEIIVISVLTLIIHKLSNFFAFKAKLKNVPW